MNAFSELDDYEAMELRDEDAFNRRRRQQSVSYWHPSDPDYIDYDGDESPEGINAVDKILTVYYSINGAPFNPVRSGVDVVVSVPFDQSSMLTYRFSKNEVGVSSASLNGDREIKTIDHDDIIGRVTGAVDRFGNDWIDEEITWDQFPETKTVEHPALTLSPGRTLIVINDRALGNSIKPQSISIAVLYADEGGAGGDLRLQFDLGNEGVLTSSYFNDRLIGSSFTSADSLMASLTNEVEEVDEKLEALTA